MIAPRVIPPPGTIVLVAALAIVASQVSLDVQSRGEVMTSEMRPQANPSVPIAEQHTNAPRNIPDSFYLALSERPLFSETRRPLDVEEGIERQSALTEPEPAVVDQGSAADPIPPDLRIKGLMVEATHQSALIEWPSGVSEWYSIKDKIDGWVIAEISINSVSLQYEEASKTYYIYKQ